MSLKTFGMLAMIAGIFSIVLAEPRFEHGEKCTPSEDWCNYGKWLFCRKGLCECLHPSRQVFDVLRNRCVGQIDTECNVYIGERDCISNANCEFNDGKSSCKCKAGFYPSSLNTCVSTTGISENAVEPANIHIIGSSSNFNSRVAGSFNLSPTEKFLGSQLEAAETPVYSRKFKLFR